MPILHLLAGPNGSGKTTYVERVLDLGLPFINADAIAARLWPGKKKAGPRKRHGRQNWSADS